MVKTSKDCCKTYQEKKGDECKIKDVARKRLDREKKEVFRSKETR